MQCVCDVCGKIFDEPFDCKLHEVTCSGVEEFVEEVVEVERNADFMCRMNHLKDVAHARAKKEAEAEAKVENQRADLEAKIYELAPRISAMLVLVNEALKLGVLSPLDGLHANVFGRRAPNLFCDGVNHKIGFYRIIPYIEHNIYPIGVGIMAGGWEGPVSLCVLPDGTVTGREEKTGSPELPASRVPLAFLEKFLKSFDEFEKQFYEIIDNMEA